MAATPHNTPRSRSLEQGGGIDTTIPIINGNIANAPAVAAGGSRNPSSPPRVGGGYDTNAIGFSLLNTEEQRAREWRAMGEGGMYNPDLDKFLMERKTDLYAANSFLFDKKGLKATSAPQIFEFSKASSVAHHLRQQPDHFSKLEHRHNQNSSRSMSRGRSPTTGDTHSARQRTQSATQARSRILSRFDPSRSAFDHQSGVIPSVTNAQLLGGAIQQNSAMASTFRGQQLNATAAALHELHQQHFAAMAGGGGGGNTIYAPHSTFQPIVDGRAGGASATLIPANMLNQNANSSSYVGHIGTVRSLSPQLLAFQGDVRHQFATAPPSSTITVSAPLPPAPTVQLQTAVMHPTAAVFNDTTLNGTNHPISSPQSSPPRLLAATANNSAVATPVDAAGSVVGSPERGGATNDLSRHTLSSMGKSRGPEGTVFASQNTHPHSQSYIAAQNYENYIRSKAGIGHVSAIENIDAMLDSLAAGEPDPITGFVQPHEFKATNSSMLRVLKNSHHLVDRSMGRQGARLGCCGQQAAAGNLVPAAGTKVDGLFVTYCQQDVHSKLDEAQRELIHEQGQRQYDADSHNEKMAALLHENQRLRNALHEATVVAEARFGKMDQALKDAVALKEEYDRRAEAAKKELQAELDRRGTERETIVQLTSDCTEKDKKIMALEVQIFDLKKNLLVAEKQVQDVYKATALATEEKIAAEGRCNQLSQQIKELGVMLMNADKAYQGAEYSRKFAEEKISQMAFLMSSGQQRVRSSKAAVSPKKGK